jgi:hypothetical protein
MFLIMAMSHVPFYLVGDACAQIVAILLVYVSILACCSALYIFGKRMLAFIDLIHATNKGEESTQFMFLGGSFALREGKIGRNASIQGSLHSCIWELFFA